MKKLALILLIAILAVGFAHAETLDFTGMTDDELISVYRAAQSEIESRGLVVGEERTLREGKYIIGEDIPAGSYTITCIGTAGEAMGDTYGSLGNMMDALDDDSDANWGDLYGSLGGLVGDSMDMTAEILGDYGDVLKSFSMKNGDHFTIQLEEGTALQISNGSCTIQSE